MSGLIGQMAKITTASDVEIMASLAGTTGNDAT